MSGGRRVPADGSTVEGRGRPGGDGHVVWAPPEAVGSGVWFGSAAGCRWCFFRYGGWRRVRREAASLWSLAGLGVTLEGLRVRGAP